MQALQEMAVVFARSNQCHGGGHARTALASYIADDAGRLFARPATDQVTRALLTATAQLTHFLADMTGDDGRAGLAQRYFHLSLSLSQQAGDRRQYAITLRAVAAQALRLRHHTYALHASEGTGQGDVGSGAVWTV